MLGNPDYGAMVREATDVGSHAGQEAIETIMRVLEPLPTNKHKLLAIIVAFSYLQLKDR